MGHCALNKVILSLIIVYYSILCSTIIFISRLLLILVTLSLTPPQFSVIIRPLFDSFNNLVSTTSPDELCRTVLSWLDQHCSLVALRPGKTCVMLIHHRASEAYFPQNYFQIYLVSTFISFYGCYNKIN